MNRKKVRIVQVLGGLYCGGTESFVMNMFRANDNDKIEFLFLVHEKEKTHYDDEIEELGGKIYRIPDRTEVGFIRYFINLIRVLRKLKPDVVHAHAMFNAGAVMVASFFAGIKKRISHAHSPGDQGSNDTKRKIFRLIMRGLIILFSTDRATCSVKAGEYLYGKKMMEKGEVEIINNGISLDQYLYVSNDKRELIKNELKIKEKNLVVGFVGRLVDVKNPMFIISLLEEITKINQNILVVIVGEGPLKDVIKDELIKKGLIDYVRIIGNRTDVPIIMSIFDVFILPSYFEGIPFVTIEAQASGIKCVVSENVPRSVDLGLGLVKHIPLNNLQDWITTITNSNQNSRNPEEIITLFHKKGFDNKSAYKNLIKLYQL